jgi:HEPN domain-containing protein
MHNQNYGGWEEEREDDDLEQRILYGLSLTPPSPSYHEEASQPVTNDRAARMDNDVQGALGLFAEATQDMATAGVELSLGRHFACVDFCNQAAEKAAQAVSLFQFGRRSMYDHDLRALGDIVCAPADIQDEMARLTPFHPEAFYADTPPEEADEIVNAEQASSYMQSARKVLRWAKAIVLEI